MAALLVVAALGCGTARSVRPVGEGNGVVDLSVGGPLLSLFDMTFPMPLAYAGYTHGLTDRVDVFGRLHLFPISMGLAGVELGGAYQLFGQSGWIPALSINGAVLAVGGATGLWAVPNATLVGSWELAERVLLYVGTTHGVSWGEQLDGTNAFDAHWAPFVGATFTPKDWRLSFTGELRWFAPTEPNDFMTVDWRGIASQGALGPHFGVSYRFGDDP